MPKTKEEHAEYMKEYMKEYNQTPQGKKSYRISNWKQQGMDHDNFDHVYDIFMNTTNCDSCMCYVILVILMIIVGILLELLI